MSIPVSDPPPPPEFADHDQAPTTLTMRAITSEQSGLTLAVPLPEVSNAIDGPTRAKIDAILATLLAKGSGVDACAVIGDDGRMVASALPSHLDAARVGGMTASLLGLGKRAATVLERGGLEEVLLRGQYGFGCMMGVSRSLLLLGIAGPMATLGLFLLDMRRAVEEIRAMGL